jgi:hypothetical protein
MFENKARWLSFGLIGGVISSALVLGAISVSDPNAQNYLQTSCFSGSGYLGYDQKQYPDLKNNQVVDLTPFRSVQVVNGSLIPLKNIETTQGYTSIPALLNNGKKIVFQDQRIYFGQPEFGQVITAALQTLKNGKINVVAEARCP